MAHIIPKIKLSSTGYRIIQVYSTKTQLLSVKWNLVKIMQTDKISKIHSLIEHCTSNIKYK